MSAKEITPLESTKETTAAIQAAARGLSFIAANTRLLISKELSRTKSRKLTERKSIERDRVGNCRFSPAGSQMVLAAGRNADFQPARPGFCVFGSRRSAVGSG